MDEIFNEPTIEQRIKDLKADGLSVREIAEKLNISKSKVGRLVNGTLSQTVPESVPTVPQSVPKCPKQENTEGQVSSIEDLKIKINSVLKTYNDRLNTLNESVADLTKQIKLLKEEMNEEFNSRLNKVIGYSLKSHIERLREDLIKYIQEIERESKSH